ncbi:hypothetical protein EV356DRAFT_507745 [Viridothelium virens]|uniref:Uncharacterized protein n=1 Tax=Viridothelium virens TaxID=1048519 RepID=A0A6A6GZ66_VIRVR|nr:hypothetical protein EV356DRAFT_507745 [Viridothelium virens]
MADITIEELLLWFPNHVLNWPGLALLVESKGWDQAHVAKFLFNNLVAKMKEEDQFTVKLNTVGSKLSRAIKKLPGYDQYSFTTRANYESLVADSLSMYLLQPPDGWDTDPAELWEFFIPPEQKEIRVPSEVRGRPFSQRLYNAYCDRHGIARPYADVPGPMPLRPGEPHPLLDSPDLDTEYPIGLGIRYVRENAQEWHAGGTNLSLTIDARIPEDYDRRDLVRDFPHLLFGDTFLYVHAELSHRDIVQIWRDENEAYLRHQWRADTDSDLVKKAEAAVRKRKQMAIENFARKEDGIVARKAKANNLTVERVHQAFNRYKGECGHKGREVRRRMSRSELDKIQRDRESRRVQRRRIENISRSPTMSSDSSKTIGRSSNRAARAFSTQKDDLLASDILYSGPPVRNHAPIANMSGPDPYPGINPIHQDYWYPNPEFLSNDPSALPLNGYEGTVAASATDGVEPWNAPMGFDFNSDFDMNKLFNNPSFASFSRNFRDSNPELTAIPNTSSAPNPKQTAQTAGPIDPLLLDSAQYERAPLETRAANSQSKFISHVLLSADTDMSPFPFPGELPKYYYNPQQLSQHQAQKSQQAFDRRTSSIPHQDQRRSTGHSSGFERFVAEITANHTSGGSFQAGLGEGFTEQEAFDAFTTVNGTIPDTEERWLQKRKSSERSQLFEGAWNAFVAMPSAAPLNMDGELDEELGEIE